MLPCVMCSLLGNAGIDLVDLDINEAGMRLSLRITSWSEAGERQIKGHKLGSWRETEIKGHKLEWKDLHGRH